MKHPPHDGLYEAGGFYLRSGLGQLAGLYLVLTTAI